MEAVAGPSRLDGRGRHVHEVLEREGTETGSQEKDEHGSLSLKQKGSISTSEKLGAVCNSSSRTFAATFP